MSGIIEGNITVGSKNIWYSVYGRAQKGVPLLVIHGGPGFLSMPQVVSDLAFERPVYFYDQLGCGKSEKAGDKSFYALDYYVRELNEVRQRLVPDSVILMGFSWGTALASAWVLKMKPEKVKGLVLCGPLLSTPRWESDQRDNIAHMPGNIRKAIEDGEARGEYSQSYQNAMMEYYQRHVCRLEPWPDFLQEALSMLNMDVYRTMWGPSEFTVSGSLKYLDLVPALKDIQQPVLLVCGDRDEAGVKTVKDFQTAFPNAQMAVIPGASHLHHIEQPEIFKAAVSGFLKTIK
ncbi:MAG: proline iminopeptidase-family hydrolase [Dehalococcoidales bacterium]|nr:proline iminopeptidase-family hydrolase [Dehalococcoidales bacterium]